MKHTFKIDETECSSLNLNWESKEDLTYTKQWIEDIYDTNTNGWAKVVFVLFDKFRFFL